MSPLRRSGFLKNGFCMDDSTLEGLFCFDILHITDVWRSVFLWLLIPVFEALRSQAIKSLQQSYLFPLCVLWKHVLSDELNEIVLILFFTNISFSGQYLRFCRVLVSAVLSGVDEAVFLQELVFGCSSRSVFWSARCYWPVSSDQPIIVGLIEHFDWNGSGTLEKLTLKVWIAIWISQ